MHRGCHHSSDVSPLAPQAKATNSRGITEHALMRVDKSCAN